MLRSVGAGERATAPGHPVVPRKVVSLPRSSTVQIRRYSSRGHMMQLLTKTDAESFVAAKPAAAVHFDAEWDKKYRTILRRKMEEAEHVLGEQVSFGEVDCDLAPDLAKAIPVVNVPSVVYYLEGKLVAALVGAEQDVLGNLEHLLRGEPIGARKSPRRGQ